MSLTNKQPTTTDKLKAAKSTITTLHRRIDKLEVKLGKMSKLVEDFKLKIEDILEKS